MILSQRKEKLGVQLIYLALAFALALVILHGWTAFLPSAQGQAVSVTATVATSVTCNVSVSSTDFGTLTSAVVSTSTPNASTTLSCNVGIGCTLNVIDTNRGLATNTPFYRIPSPDTAFNSTSTLAAGTEGMGIMATTTAGGSGGTLFIFERYQEASPNLTKVGGLASTSALGLASSTAAINNRQLIIRHKAAISGTTQAAAYTDSITYSCASN